MDSNEARDIYSFKLFRFDLVKPNPTCEQPVARSAHRSICFKKYLYIFGGYNPDLGEKMLVRDMWKFNYASRKWSLAGSDNALPSAVTSSALVKNKRELLVYGGTGIPFGPTCSNELHCMQLKEDTVEFSKVAIAGRPPQPTYGHAIILQRGKLYTIGGNTGITYTSDIHRVNLRKSRKVWKKLRPLKKEGAQEKYIPEGRYRHEVAFDKQHIYVLGGGTNNEIVDAVLERIPTFTVKKRFWEERLSLNDSKEAHPYPLARKAHGVAQLETENGSFAFMLGGYQNSQHVFKDLWRLELSCLQWTLLNEFALPRGLYFHSTSITREGKMYVFGGMTECRDCEPLNRTDNLYSAWMCIPKLHEICWEAVLYYTQHHNPSKETFVALKVPQCFIERLD